MISNNVKWRRHATLTGLALTSFAASTLAFGAESSGSPIEEVIVTAQKREERLQDVPISIAVIPAEALQAFKLNETTDLQYLVPGVSLTNTAGPRSFGFFVRGIGTSSFSSESIEGSVAYVVDGVVLGQAGSSQTDLPDIERIEVLRGPQGTLFGKNASAGVINVTTRRPANEFAVEGSVSYADPLNERKVNALVTGPITDNLRFLVSGRMNQRDGTVDNIDGRDLNNRDDYGLRGKLEYAPNEDVTVTLIGDYWKREAECCVWTLRRTGPTPGAGELSSLNAGIVPSPTNERQNINGDVFSEPVSYGASAQVDYGFDNGYTLTSITSWRRWKTHDGLDSDSTTLNLLDVNFADFKQKQWTQELRITSPQDQLVDYVAGLFYFDSDVHSTSRQVFPLLAVPYLNKVVDNDTSTQNLAAFGQANVNFTEDFRLIVGGRVLQEKAEAAKHRVDPRNGLTDNARADKTDDAVVWRGGLQYDFTDDFMSFVTATRGYKGGGFDTNIGLGTLPDVAPEEPMSYEAGVRTAWMDQRLIVNVTAFKTKVDNYQVSARDPDTAVYYIRNGNADTEGVEFDLVARPLENHDLTFNASGAYLDARWGDFRNAACYSGQTAAQGCVGGQQNVSDKRMPFSSEWTFSGAVHYGMPVASSYYLSLDVGANYRSELIAGFPNNPNYNQSGYTLLNSAIGFGAEDGSWKLSVFGKNLTDKNYVAAMIATPLGGAPLNISHFIPYEARRIVGLSLDVAF